MTKKDIITIRDVARHAGVSITSASYALNGTGTISAETRKRVLESAEKVNYHPNAFARNLKNKRTYTIGVFIVGFGGLFYEEILDGIHDTILKTDYELIVCPKSQAIQKIFTHRQVDGAIVFDDRIKGDLILKIASNRFPVVVMDRYLESEFVLPMLLDNQTGTREAFYHLYNQGARKIYFVSGVWESFDNVERMNSFLAEADKNNLSVRCFRGDFTEKSGYAIGREIIASQDLPEAVFCANDQMAIGFLRAMKENGLRAPQDIAIVGFDDIQISKYLQPALSTIGASRFGWGASAAAQLIDFLEQGRPFHPSRIHTQLIERESSSLRLAGITPE